MKKLFLSISYVILLLGLFSFVTVLVGCGEEEVNSYKVQFVVDGEVVKEENVEKGQSATAPTDVEKEGYDFIGWDQVFVSVESDLTINAIYAIKQYTVTFLDDEGNILAIEKVDYKTAANAPTPPEKENKIFKGWDKDITAVTESMIVNAIYGGEEFTITYYDGKETLDLEPNVYESGYGVELPVPTKEGYQFIGWFLSELSLTQFDVVDTSMSGELKFYARYIETEKHDLIVLPESKYYFTGIKTVPTGNTFVYQPEWPQGAPTGVANYNWAISDTNIATVSTFSSITAKSAGYAILTATHKTENFTISCIIKSSTAGIELATEEEANTIEICKVIFRGKNGENLGTSYCHKGGAVIYPKPPVYEGLKFTGWSASNYNITSNTIITAQYSVGTNNYAGKSFAIIGDSISTYEGYIPSTFDKFYPYATADVNDVNKTWWMQAINKIGGTLFVNNSYSGTCVGDSSAHATKNDLRLKYTQINGQSPDVILIFMGSNDCASKYVTIDQFKSGYDQMLTKLQALCPESEIVLCTLPTSPFYSGKEVNHIEYNKIIREYATQYGLNVVNLEPISLSGHLVDSAHPNTSGMTVIAEQVVAELLKH